MQSTRSSDPKSTHFPEKRKKAKRSVDFYPTKSTSLQQSNLINGFRFFSALGIYGFGVRREAWEVPKKKTVCLLVTNKADGNLNSLFLLLFHFNLVFIHLVANYVDCNYGKNLFEED